MGARFRGWLLAVATLSSCGCSPTPGAARPPSEEHPEFDFLLHVGSASAAPAPSSSSWAARITPVPRASAPAADDPYAGCRSKIGSSLAVKLEELGSSRAQLKVTVEFNSPKDDDEVPGLGFIRPAVAVGALSPGAIAKLCQHPDLKWIDATPTFMGP